MAIIGTLAGEIVYQRNLGDGRIEVLFRYTDHQANTYDRGPKRIPEGTNLTDLMEQERQLLFGELAEHEVNGYVAQAEALSPSFDPNFATQWNEVNDFDRRVLGYLMTYPVDQIEYTLGFWAATQSRGGANTGQRATFLGVPRAEYELVEDRYGLVQGLTTSLQTDRASIWISPLQGWE